VWDIYFILAIIFVDVWYWLGKARIEDVIVVTSISVLWIIIRLLIIQYSVDKIQEKIEESMKRGEEK
jgi:hypothetical protein